MISCASYYCNSNIKKLNDTNNNNINSNGNQGYIEKKERTVDEAGIRGRVDGRSRSRRWRRKRRSNRRG